MKSSRNKEYFSFSSPLKEDNKENKSKVINRIKNKYPELELYPNITQSQSSIDNKDKNCDSNLSSRISLNNKETAKNVLNKSLKSTFEYNSNDNTTRNQDPADNNYTTVNDTAMVNINSPKNHDKYKTAVIFLISNQKQSDTKTELHKNPIHDPANI